MFGLGKEPGVETEESAMSVLKELREILKCSEGQSVIDRARHFMNPEKFISTDDVIMAAIKVEKGIAICHGAVSRADMEIAMTRLNYKTMMMFQQMDLQKAMEARNREKGIIQ